MAIICPIKTHKSSGKWGGRNWNIYWLSKSFDTVDHNILFEKKTVLWYQRYGTQLVLQSSDWKTLCWIQSHKYRFTLSPMWCSPRIQFRSITILITYKWPCHSFSWKVRHIICWWFQFLWYWKNMPSLIKTVNTELIIVVTWLNAN